MRMAGVLLHKEDRPMDRWVDKWMEEWMNAWAGGQMGK